MLPQLQFDDDLEDMDLTPTPRIFESYRGTNITNREIVGELIDNSLDWGATEIRVSISLEGNTFTIWDNGQGCIDMQKILTLGLYQGGNRTGRFGVGLKQASCALGPDLYIESAQNGRRAQYHMNWPVFAAGTVADYKRKHPPREAYDGPSFMRLEIRNADPARLARIKSKEQSNKLRLMYYPALKSGCSIVYDGQRLEPVEFPALKYRRESSGIFRGGRWHLTAGLFAEPQRLWPHGFTIAFRNRLMVMGVKDVYQEYDSNKVFAYLELIEDAQSYWQVNTNKNGAVYQEELVEILFPEIEPLLKRAEEQFDNVLDRDLVSKIEAGLNEELGGRPRKEKRKSPEKKNMERKPPKTEGSPRRHAQKTQPGTSNITQDCTEASGNGNCTGYRVTLTHDGPEIASLDAGKTVTWVRFFKKHPAVEYWRRAQDHANLLFVAHSLIQAQPRMIKRGEQYNLDEDDPFGNYVRLISESAAKRFQKEPA